MPSKIVIIGPESTGKSTLTKALADHFNEPWVQEYAREYIEQLESPYDYNDLLAIAKGQIEKENKLEQEADRFLFCDTDLHVVNIWSQHRYGKTHPWILEQVSIRPYDLYLITNIDIPWEEDPQREHPDPEMRKHFMDLYTKTISETGIPYIVLKGDHENRFKMAIDMINRVFIN